MTRMNRINELEAAALRIQRNPDSIIGGLKAFNSGYETHLKPAAQRKLDKINSEMDILLDAAIQEIHQQEQTGADDLTHTATIQAMKQWCEDNYSNGADTMVECWDNSDYEALFEFEGKAKTDTQAWATLQAIADVYADRQTDSRNSAF